MTRFLVDIEEAISLIKKSTKYSGCNIIPKTNSFKIKDLLEIYQEEFNLKFTISKPRTGEKIHEIMASNEELRRIEYIKKDNIYLLHPKIEFSPKIKFPNQEYSSRDFVMDKNSLRKVLQNKNFYKP